MFKNYIHEYASGVKTGQIEYRYRVDRCLPLSYKKKELPIHPYILGLWLGDGKTDDGYINVSNNDFDETIKNIKSAGYIIYSVINDRTT